MEANFSSSRVIAFYAFLDSISCHFGPDISLLWMLCFVVICVDAKVGAAHSK